jgi:chromosome segregation ATPase
MKVSTKLMSVLSYQLATPLLLLSCLLLGWASADEQVAFAAGTETLPAAQTRLRYAQEELESARLQVQREERRLKDAEESLARQQKRVEEEQLKVDRSKSALADAKTRAEQAKQKHDQAYADIQRLYRERQQAPSLAPEASTPQSN